MGANMTYTKRQVSTVQCLVLEAVDNSMDGLDLDEARKVFCPAAIPFAAFVYVVNRLIAMGLIEVNSDHIATRVRT